MKKPLVLVVLLFILGITALGMWIASLDPSQFIPLIRKHLEKTLQSSITYSRASLSFSKGISIEIQDLVVEPFAPHSPEDRLQVAEARALLDLAPLFSRRLQIGSIELVSPQIYIDENLEGKIHVRGLGQVTPDAPSHASSAESLLPVSLLIQNFQTANAGIHFSSSRRGSPKQINLTGLHLRLNHPSLTSPVKITASGALEGQQKNFALSGALLLPTPFHSGLRGKDFKLEIDLNQLDLLGILSQFSDFAPVPLEKNPAGSISLVVPAWEVSRDQKPVWESSLIFQNGQLLISGVSTPLSDIQLQAQITPENIDVDHLRFTAAGGQINLFGKILQWNSKPSYDFQTDFQSLDLAFTKISDSNEPYLEGRASGTLRARAQGQDWEEAAPTLEGQGSLRLSEGRLVNLNLMQEIFRQISIIPGLIDRLNQALPPESQEKLNRNFTPFAATQLAFTVTQGKFFFQNTSIQTDSFRLAGWLEADWKNNFRSQAMLSLSPDFTEAAIHIVNELRLLTSSQAELEIPFQVSGVFPEPISFSPDLQSIGARLATSTLSQLIGGFLKPQQQETQNQQNQANTAASAEPTTASGSPVSRSSGNLSSILDALVTKPRTAPNTSTRSASHSPATQTSQPSNQSGSVFEQLLAAALEKDASSK